MGNNREALANIGREALSNNEALVAAGQRTIRDEVKALLASKGLGEAVGFELNLLNGEKITILSDDNPNMNRPAAEIARTPSGAPDIAVKPSGRAGQVTFRVS